MLDDGGIEKGPIKKMKRRATPGCDVNSRYLRERERLGKRRSLKTLNTANLKWE